MLGFSEILIILAIFGFLFLPKLLLSKIIDYEQLSADILEDLKSNNLISEEKNFRINKILDSLYEVSNSNLFCYSHYILLKDELNAMALPNGTILITEGFLESLEKFTDDEIAGVLSHEIGHIELGHAKSRIEEQIKADAFESSVQIISRNPFIYWGIKGVSFLSQQLFCRGQEYEADQYAITLLSKSKYNPVGLIALLEKFKKWETTPRWVEILSTHPHLDERISKLKSQ